MKKVKVIKAFNDKINGFITRHVNETFECPEDRQKSLKQAASLRLSKSLQKPKRKQKRQNKRFCITRRHFYYAQNFDGVKS